MKWDAEKYILFEDDALLVCQKPAGMAVQNRNAGSMDLYSLLRNYLAGRSVENKVPYLAVIHRLDQPVEGLVVFAKTEKAAAELSRQMQQGEMRKIYFAVVKKNGSTGNKLQEKEIQNKEKEIQNEEKEIQNEETEIQDKETEIQDKELQEKNVREGLLEDYLLKDGRTNISRIVRKTTPGAKKASLFYRVIVEDDEKMLVRINLLTGRHHQIRVQMANAGMPLLGDRKYGDAKPGEKGKFPALCAAELSFTHPSTGKHMHFYKKPEGYEFAGFEDAIEWSRTER